MGVFGSGKNGVGFDVPGLSGVEGATIGVVGGEIIGVVGGDMMTGVGVLPPLGGGE